MKHLIYLIVVAFYLSLFLVVFSGAIPYNSTSKQTEVISKFIFSFTPQGWAFFTRDPKEAQFYLFKENGNVWEIEDNKKAQLSSMWGIKICSSYAYYELSELYKKIPPSLFKNCDIPFKETFAELPCGLDSEYEFENDLNYQTIQGKYILMIQEITPWSWYKKYKNSAKPTKIIKIYVK